MAELADYLTVKEVFEDFLLQLGVSEMSLEIDFFKYLSDGLRWRVDFVRIIEFRPDKAQRLTWLLEKDNYLAEKHFSAALQAASFPESLW